MAEKLAGQYWFMKASSLFASSYAGARGISTIDDLKRHLRSAWREDTSVSPREWSRKNPAIGQCAVTALIVQDLFGGELLRGYLTNGTHYWNCLPNGQELDLTAEQFPNQPIIGNTEQRSRDYVLSFPATVARYLRLRKNLGLSPNPQEGLARTLKYAFPEDPT